MHTFVDKHNCKVLLLHIPKCAGTSCGHFLHKYSSKHKWYNLKDSYYNDHLPIHVAKQIVDYDYAIAFVRNPFTRFASRYSYLTKSGYYSGYENYTIDRFLDEKPNLSGCPGSWEPQGWRKQHEYIDDSVQTYKIEEHDPINILNKLLGTKHTQENVNKSIPTGLTEHQKDVIINIYREDFERLNYDLY